MTEGAFRICLITTGHLSTNPRIVKEADALAAVGYAVEIVATNFSRWGQSSDRSFEGRQWRVAHRVSFGPLAPRRRRALQIIRQRVALMMDDCGVRPDAVLNAACHPAAPDLIGAAMRIRADLYIAHYPPALAAAAIAARHHGGRYAYDAEDFHPGDWPDDPRHNAKRRRVRAIEQRHLPGCAYFTAASPGIAAAYAEAYGIARPTVLLNVFPLAEAPPRPSPAGTATPGPSIYWFSQTIGPDRGLECAVRAIAHARARPHLYLRGTPATGFRDRLLSIATEMGVAERLHILSPELPAEMARHAAPYDVGLSGEPGHTPNNRIALGNKLFTYLLAGLPVIMSDIPAHRAFAPDARDATRLYAIDDVDSLVRALDALLSDPDALAASRAAAFRLARTRFNWNIERARFLDIVAKTARPVA